MVSARTVIDMPELSSSLYRSGNRGFATLPSRPNLRDSIRTLYSPTGAPSPDPPVTRENVPSVPITPLGCERQVALGHEIDLTTGERLAIGEQDFAFYFVHLEYWQRIGLAATGKSRTHGQYQAAQSVSHLGPTSQVSPEKKLIPETPGQSITVGQAFQPDSSVRQAGKPDLLARPEVCRPRAERANITINQYESDETVSPPLSVRIERNETRLMLFLRNRTEPSPKSALMPPG